MQTQQTLKNMLSRLKTLVLISLFVAGGFSGRAQDNDYLKHGKIFCLCSFRLECSYCHSCNAERYAVKINNNLDKKISNVYYKFYSEPFNKILEREAEIDPREIAGQQAGLMHICVPNGRHWIISKIVYADGTSNTFKLHDRLQNFRQDADECDCND